jgi:hypothetical protein
MQPIDGVGGKRHRGVEAKGVGGLNDVVVNRLGDANNGQAALVELVGDAKSAVAADDDERIEREVVEHLDASHRVIVGAPGRVERIRERVPAVRRAEDGAAGPVDASDVGWRDPAPAVRLDEAFEAVLEPYRLAVVMRRRLDNGPNYRVQPGGVAAPRQQTDTPDTLISARPCRHRSRV